MAVRGCGLRSIYMLPKSFGRVAGDVFCENGGVYFVTSSDAGDGNRGETTLLAVHPNGYVGGWEYSPLQGTIVAIGEPKLLICRLMETDANLSRQPKATPA